VLRSPVSQIRCFLHLVVFALLARVALAGPLDDAHVGDTGFSGPTSGDLTAVYWNPAGLGLLQGPQLMLGGALQMTSVSVAPAAIDPATGTNSGSVKGGSTLHPFRWPLGPSGFFAVGAGIGRRFGIAMALYSPYASKLTMDPSADGQEPTRYHLVRMELEHIAPTIGLAIHAADSIQVGFASGMLLPSARLVFDENTATGSPTYDLATPGTVFMPTYFLSFGALYKHGRFSLGLAYTTAPLGAGGLITLPLENTRITLPSGEGSLCPDTTPNCVIGQMSYRLPSIWTAGATWQASKHWSATGIVRWVRTGSYDKVTILVTGPTPQPGQPALGTTVPDHIVLYRGFNDSVDVRGRVVYQDKHFRVGGTLRLETSAVPASHVSAAAIDGTKIEPALAAEMRIWRQISLSVGYAFMWMLPVDTGASVYDPTAAAACAANGGDLSTAACQARMNGQSRPSAAGTYHMWRQTLSVLTTFGF
jgi:long-chain fatty acid transport protein